jgi:hypothetical protein
MGEDVIPFILGGGRVDVAENLITRSFLEALAGFLALYIFLSVRSEEQYGA